jgi:hypothetical protein
MKHVAVDYDFNVIKARRECKQINRVPLKMEVNVQSDTTLLLHKHNEDQNPSTGDPVEHTGTFLP